jgi:hypothetical protein
VDEGITGLATLDAVLDVADARDLENAIAAKATDLATAGSTESLDVRRAKAVGEIARGHLTLDLSPDTDPVEATQQAARKPRQTILTIHLTDQTPATGVVDCPELGTHLSLDQVADWVRELAPEHHQITLQPVIDLNDPIENSGYTPSPRLQRQIRTGEPVCAFPYCTRPSPACDLDHVHPYADGGPTSSGNLAPLCRRHHRVKTFTTWTYRKVKPGHYTWTSPTGLTITKTLDGTTREQ